MVVVVAAVVVASIGEGKIKIGNSVWPPSSSSDSGVDLLGASGARDSADVTTSTSTDFVV